MKANIQLKNEIAGRESHGAWRQNELIGGKPPVVKYCGSELLRLHGTE
jgi:hypothetical protein